MVNPCVVKGISIFLALAERFPRYSICSACRMGDHAKDRENMSRLPTLLFSKPSEYRSGVIPSASSVDAFIWLEGFGLIAMEAMLRGLPVIASNSGGLVEAKSGTGFVIPIRPIERFEPVFDETHMPKPIDVPQDIEPWAEALRNSAYRSTNLRNRSRQIQGSCNWLRFEIAGSRFRALLVSP